MISRRFLLTGGTAFLIAAPALVRAQSLMPIRVMEWEPDPPTPNLAHYFDHYADGSFFKETVNFDTRTSKVKWRLGCPGKFLWGFGKDLHLSQAEMRRRQVESWVTRRMLSTEPSHV